MAMPADHAADAALEQAVRRLVPIHGLSTALQNGVVRDSTVLRLGRQQYALREGPRDGFCFYLLEGELDLYHGPRHVGRLASGSEGARYALAPVQPRRLSIRTRTPVTLLQVEQALLDKLLVLDLSRPAHTELNRHYDEPGWLFKVLRSELFARIPAIYIKQIFDALEPVSISAGKTVIRQGELGDYYYIVRSGRCTVTRRLAAHSPPITLAELGPGSSFGEEALVADGRRNATVTMVADGILLRLDRGGFDRLIKKPTLSAVDYAQALQAVAAGARWLDVRFDEERQNCHIPGAQAIPLPALRDALPDLPRQDRYVVFCDTGGRSSVAAFLLLEHGLNAVYLDGGLNGCPMSERIRGRRGSAATGGVAPAGRATPPDKARRIIRRLKARLAQARSERDAALAERRSPALHTGQQRTVAGLRQEARQARVEARQARLEAAAKAERLLADYQETAEREYQEAMYRQQAENRRLRAEIDRLRELLGIQHVEARERNSGR